ncbi:MAG: metal ABC transporter ATP-binding protein [Clostridiales bacterium]|nr:metal ABC transporter ATP-binding protein [Clostridiales bacterium]
MSGESLKTNEYIAIAEDLTVAYGEKPVLWDVDFNVPKGKLMAIVGPNGAGKSTLIKSMLGLLKPVAGKVEFFINSDNKPSNFKDKGISRKIAYVPQSGSVDWDFPATALDVVLMGRYGHLGWIKRPKKADKQLALEMLEKVGMKEFQSRQISQLSGGQQQRVFLARALVQQAELYFMDEPFKGVDAKTEKAIITLLKELKAQGKTVVVVHHDLRTVTEYFDWVTLINMRIIAEGEVNETFTNENIDKAYGRIRSDLVEAVNTDGESRV